MAHLVLHGSRFHSLLHLSIFCSEARGRCNLGFKGVRVQGLGFKGLGFRGSYTMKLYLGCGAEYESCVLWTLTAGPLSTLQLRALAFNQFQVLGCRVGGSG